MAAVLQQRIRRRSPSALRRWMTTYSSSEHTKVDVVKALEQLDIKGGQLEEYSQLLRLCAERRSLADGKLVHDHLARSGYSGDSFLGNLLVDMYGKCGDADAARAAFELIRDKNRYSWTILVTALSKTGHSREVFKLVERMDLEGIRAEKITYLGLVDACAKLLDLKRSQKVHSRIVQSGWDECQIVANAVVSMFGKCGDVQTARLVFYSLREKSVVSWNALIGAYAKNGFGREALKMLMKMDHEGVEADRITFLSVVDACTSLGCLPESRLTYARVLAKGFDVDVAVGTSLVNMFGRCCSLEDAKMAFDGMKQRNVISWNVMIQAYTQSGHPEAALKLFWEMKDDVQPDEVTFINAIDACVGLKFLADGKEIHQRITSRGLDKDSVMGNALMNMYSKCASPVEARLVFEKMVVRDLVSWNTMIAAHARNGFGKEGMEVFQEMVLLGIVPDQYTFISTLDACCGLETGGARRGGDVHQLIRESGFMSDVALVTALIKMYGKVGLVEEARRVFDGMSRRVSLTWGRMITAYGQNGCGREAIELYKKMDVEPDKMTFASVVDACSNVMALEEGRKVHERILQMKLETDLVLDNTLLDLYGLCGSLQEAKAVFDGMKERDVVSWNAILRAHNFCDRPKEALGLFYEMEENGGVKPDRVSYVSALDACSAVGGSEGLVHGRTIHSLVVANKVHVELYLGTALVTMYGRCGGLKDAEVVFDEMRCRNTITWTSMIRGYSWNGLAKEAMLAFHRMELEGCAADKVTLIAVLDAARGSDDVAAGERVHDRLSKLGFISDPAVQSALVGMYGKCGCLTTARKLFNAMKEPCVVSWNSMIAAYSKNGEKQEVLRLFDDMQKSGVEASRATYLGVLNVGFTAFSADEARHLQERARSDGLHTDCLVGTALLNMEMRFGRIDEARRLFDGLEYRDLVSWTSMIMAYASQGRWGEAVEMFKEMQVEGTSPDDVVFIGVLFACNHGGRFGEGWEWFVMMQGEYGIEALVEHYCCMVDMLGRAGKVAEAEDLILGMPFKPDEATWTALVGACKVQGDVERAERVSKAMEFEQQSSAAHLLLSNTLAAAV